MRKHPATTRPCRPSVDVLEGRPLLNAAVLSPVAIAATVAAEHRTTSGHPTVAHGITETSAEHNDLDPEDADELLTLGATPVVARSPLIAENSPAPAVSAKAGQETSPGHVIPFSDLATTSGLPMLAHLSENWENGHTVHDRPQGSLAADEFNSRSVELVADPVGRSSTAEHLLELSLPAKPALGGSKPGLDAFEIPQPRGLGMIAEVLPFGRDSLEQAVERFCGGIEEIGATPLGWSRRSEVVLPPLVLATSAVALEIARRRASRTAAGRPITRLATPRGGLGTGRLPGMPGTY